MKDIKYSEILRLNKEFTFDESVRPIEIRVLSNVSVQQSKEIFEFTLRSESIPANVYYGDYDNIIQDSLKYQTSNVVIIFWEICNISDGFEYSSYLLDEDYINKLIERTKQNIDLVFQNLKATSLVLFNRFSALLFSYPTIQSNNLKLIADQLNQYLEEKATSTIKIIDIDKVIAQAGVERSLNLRFYFSSKALYSIDFFKTYAQFVKPYILAANGKAKKALIFDCDNTLWGGIVGEDGIDGIEMSVKTKNGKIFNQVQSIALALNQKGILLGLCSKNNVKDVDEVLNNHPDILIKNEYITIKKVNWNDKITNLREIASELNIGLDSIVFVDDSSFEVNLVKERLPEIKIIQVPEKLYEYPITLLKHFDLFYNLSYSREDKQKTKLYKQQSLREVEKKSFANIDDYLVSLELCLTVFKNDPSLIARLSQMTQKTNQFNLTTKRYTETEISNFIYHPTHDVFGISVKDKFGDNGVTGLCILNLDKDTYSVTFDVFLMSCRIIGRKIEYAFMDHLVSYLKENNVKTASASYIPTKKNGQVSDFYANCFFNEKLSIDGSKNYVLNINEYKPHNIDYIKIEYGEVN